MFTILIFKLLLDLKFNKFKNKILISNDKIERRLDFLSDLLNNCTKILGLGLSLVFIFHILFFSSSYEISTSQILQGLSGFTLLYYSIKAKVKKCFKDKKFYFCQLDDT